MSRNEFIGRLPRGILEPTDGEFVAIQQVYQHHPCISETKGKDQVAMLYCEFGMRIFYDMQETALRCREIEEQRQELKCELREHEEDAEKCRNELVALDKELTALARRNL